MEIQLPPGVFPGAEDPSRGIRIKDPFLAEDIDVVDAEFASGTELSECGDLDIYHVLSCILCRASSTTHHTIWRSDYYCTQEMIKHLKR